ncbi:hypothetical protein NW756_003930 [Fusarium oxysporum]|nr:hypothetical protein NW753_007529 [Fusarium oxysporum]KAJ4062445.1 hypothetical protein NW763_005864 [Fusarium oxysporum]KAJ4099310.1 hypothetical protein NW756_003930 [Fusarium oxysporum]
MSLTLAPYNDAMRIGQGFNSYTHEICIDGAVVVDAEGVHNDSTQVERPSQVVSYSARAVEKLSDIIQTMNVSYPHSIKKGSVTVSGSNSAIDEATFKSADINIIVTVKVTNQTTMIKNNARFVPMKGIDPSSQAFNEAYGDSYISGFIKGGEFTGIISVKVIDRNNVDLTVKKIKARLDAKDSSKATEFTLNSSDSFSSRGSASVMENTESHIHVSWMGGGQIKNENTPWDIDSIFKAAAAFPQRVSERPQLTWAILTKYKSNRSFIEWASNKPVKTLEYDQVSSYTAELFDSYMDYKILLKYVQLIIDDPESYEAVDGEDALDTSIDTLLGVRFAMRKEQGKIIEAISVLSRDPGILSRQGGWGNGRANKVLNRILSKTTGYTSEKSRSATQKDSVHGHEGFDFSALIPAEVWRKWMAIQKLASPTSSNSKIPTTLSPSAGLPDLGPPPSDDQDWHGNYASALQAKLNTVTRDLEAKTEEHTGQAKRFQDEIGRIKSDSASELEALRSKHNDELEDIRKRQSDYDTLKAGQQSEIEQTLQRLEKKKQEAVEAVRKDEQEKYGILQKKHDDLSRQLESSMANIETRMQNEKKTALEKLEKEKNDAYNSLKESYESLKKQLGDMIATDATLATDSKRLVAEKISLTTQLQDKTSAYNSLEADLKRDHEKTLSAKETAWTTERTTLNGQINKVTNERSLADAKISKLKDTMLWAGLYENSRMDNCLPSGFSGWTVMIMMPHSRMALNANNDHHDMAHAWSFNMWNDDEVFKLAKANNHPDTPWTITNLASGKLLVFLNGETDWQVRCRERNDPRLVGRSAYWYIGRGAADFNTTWVLKNAEWVKCDKFSYHEGESVSTKTYTTAEEYDIEVVRDDHKPKTVFSRTGLKGQTFGTPADAYAVGCNWPQALGLHLEEGRWPSAFYLIIIRIKGIKGRVHEREGFFIVKDKKVNSAKPDFWPIARGMLRIPKNAPREANGTMTVGHGATPRYPSLEYSWYFRYSRHYADAGWTASQATRAPCLGHDEYWSWEQRDTLDDFVDRGGRFARFGGNFIWQVRFDEAMHTQYCYQVPQADPMTKKDPTRVTTMS